MKTASEKSVSKGIRILQIIVGIIAIALSIAVIINPGFGIEILVFLLSLTLLVVGIERVSIGFLPYIKKSSTTRISNIILGGLAIALSIIVIAIPIYNRIISYFTCHWTLIYRSCKNYLWSYRQTNLKVVKNISPRSGNIVNRHIIYGICKSFLWFIYSDIYVSS